jgi:hypothetical protein
VVRDQTAAAVRWGLDSALLREDVRLSVLGRYALEDAWRPLGPELSPLLIRAPSVTLNDNTYTGQLFEGPTSRRRPSRSSAASAR